jgi:hypothetical protein
VPRENPATCPVQDYDKQAAHGTATASRQHLNIGNASKAIQRIRKLGEGGAVAAANATRRMSTGSKRPFYTVGSWRAKRAPSHALDDFAGRQSLPLGSAIFFVIITRKLESKLATASRTARSAVFVIECPRRHVVHRH